MADVLPLRSAADRLRIFISSTIGECAAERDAARRAITGLNFEPMQFEREGARAEAPRDFYLRKLQDAHIVIGIYRSSYGWIDAAKGMTISGLEDEYREARRLGKDFLVYVLKMAPAREERLSVMIEELKGGPHVLYFFDDGEDLEARIRDDLTALVTDRVTSGQAQNPEVGSAASVLEVIFRGNALRVRRLALLDDLMRITSLSRVLWVTGSAGAGKTALAAEWADARGAAYVNARGLDPRSVLLGAAKALGIASAAEHAIPLFDDARSLLLTRWRNGANWPLILDDLDDIGSVWPVLSECLSATGAGSVILVARDPPATLPGERLEVPGFSAQELDALRAIAGIYIPEAVPGDLPLVLRRSCPSAPSAKQFDGLDPLLREALGYLALSPAPLGLEDLQQLLGSAVPSATELAERLDTLDSLLMETTAGYVFVHDVLRDDAAALVQGRPQLHALLVDRLSRRLARTGRTWAAFQLRRSEQTDVTAQLANGALREAVFSGSNRHLIAALEFLVDFYRARAERGPLVSVLVALAEARVNEGRPGEAPGLLEEAQAIAEGIGDRDAERTVAMLRASLALRRSASEAALAQVRVLCADAKREGRRDDVARLLLEEGIAFLSINETNIAVPLFREARALFLEIGDGYGVEIATRNLVIGLASSKSGLAESEGLRAELCNAESDSPRYRAWLCNLLVPQMRRDKRFDEAEAMAREAIAIAESLGDQYLVAINLIGLGNVLREAGRLDAALEAYGRSGQLAQAVGRPDVEGRSSRLLAMTENTAAEQASATERRDHARRAEQFATHAVGLLSRSFAWAEHATSLEERGDALRLQGRDREAMTDYANAIRGYLKAEDEGEAERLLRYFVSFIQDQADTPALIAQAFGAAISEERRAMSGIWVDALVGALDHCPRAVAPSVLGTLVRAFLPAQRSEWWLECLVRCLLAADRNQERSQQRPAMGSLLLLAILGFSPHRGLRNEDLLNLAGLCIGQSDSITIRHRPGSDLDLIVWLGREKKILFTVRTEARVPEAIFVALVIGCFLDAFASELSGILSVESLAEGAALDVTIFAQAAESKSIAEFFGEALVDKPVATARIMSKDGEEVPIIVITRPDAIAALKAVSDRGGELEFMLARFLEEVVHAISGGSLDDPIFYAKVRDLLMSVMR